MKIALAQLNPTIGDLEGNSRKIEDACRQAGKAEADLVDVPELVLTGYPPQDLLCKPALISEGQKILESLVDRIQGPAVLIGHVEKSKNGTGWKYCLRHGGLPEQCGSSLLKNTSCGFYGEYL